MDLVMHEVFLIYKASEEEIPPPLSEIRSVFIAIHITVRNYDSLHWVLVFSYRIPLQMAYLVYYFHEIFKLAKA